MPLTRETDFPANVEIIEVGPRDGLQREATLVSTDDKVALINALVEAGLKRIQVTSFVHPKWVPQMADAEDVCARIPKAPDVIYSGLALNRKGVERAHAAGLTTIDISVSASDTHSRKNANRSLAQALQEFDDMYALGREVGMTIRGGIQCAFGYLQVGDVDPATVIEIAQRHLDLGVDELALADTSGLADPVQITEMIDSVLPLAGDRPVILHLHDTRGLGLANVLAALRAGVSRFDTAFGGLGGCPFIEGATGNIATEDTVYMLHQMGIETGIDLSKLSRVTRDFERVLGSSSMPGKVYKLLASDAPRLAQAPAD